MPRRFECPGSRACRTFHLGDCLEVMRDIPDSSVALIIADGPYHRVKDEAWDRQWKDDAAYLEWIGRLCVEWARVLRPNGSLYCFASPRMAARVECKVGETFHVLNQIVWAKPDPSSSINCGPGNGGRMSKAAMRVFYPNTERIVFAECVGANCMALGEESYAARCDELRGIVFDPLRTYLEGERQAAGLMPGQINALCGYRKRGMAQRHYFSRSQFHLPTATAYARLQTTGRFSRSYDELLREYESLGCEYESLKAEYEGLRRPFAVSADVPYTDVWDFPTVPARPGKHPCQKPEELIAHIVATSSRPGDVVLDPFAGSGVTGRACERLGRSAILIEQDPKWFARMTAARDAMPLFAGESA